jgi:hypothetical protein
LGIGPPAGSRGTSCLTGLVRLPLAGFVLPPRLALPLSIFPLGSLFSFGLRRLLPQGFAVPSWPCVRLDRFGGHRFFFPSPKCARRQLLFVAAHCSDSGAEIFGGGSPVLLVCACLIHWSVLFLSYRIKKVGVFLILIIFMRWFFKYGCMMFGEIFVMT